MIHEGRQNDWPVRSLHAKPKVCLCSPGRVSLLASFAGAFRREKKRGKKCVFVFLLPLGYTAPARHATRHMYYVTSSAMPRDTCAKPLTSSIHGRTLCMYAYLLAAPIRISMRYTYISSLLPHHWLCAAINRAPWHSTAQFQPGASGSAWEARRRCRSGIRALPFLAVCNTCPEQTPRC